MKSSEQKSSLVIITNLYPLPWQPNRATFNRQQFAQLDDSFDTSVLVPVAFAEWFKYRKQIKQSQHLRYLPYFYIPKIGRRFYSLSMLFSIIFHSGFWLWRKKPNKLLASWAFPEAVATSWLSRLLRCDFYFKVHGSDINLHGKVPARAKQIVNASKKAKGILSVSQALADEMIAMGIAKEKIQVIYNGVDHEKFKVNKITFDKNTPDYVLYVGNLKKEKGVIELLEGFAAIAKQYPLLQLHYAGAGSMSTAITTLAKTMAISDRVILHGSVDHERLPALISQARILALPSYNEGVPNVVLEAMACGTPVLVSNVGGIPEVVDEAICGKVIAAKSVDAVTQGLEYMLTTQWHSEKIQQHSQQFTWQNNKQQLLHLLNNVNSLGYKS
ncbi:Glycosyltransferase involved in cell wall bisynthesis [Colwellia chukchiensis]|uniref:Glycosyltransferase involved in cell wall bisynthesis n=1 Tax=Colwellia chukchiensis TaxID=641665 RepID=A0A1H7SEN9_9GAMM|nr:glycosyltransferase [Colwellia chukchiensis]SEL70666.1 Glycosyltransferase involved in cell wall bisynthesis [Colwellia chukchiensis]